MSIVIDSSITLAWYFDDKGPDGARRILDAVADGGAWVPTIWRLEVANGLQQGIKRKRIDKAGRNRALESLAELDIAVDPDTNTFAWNRTVDLSDRFRLTTYDASYLELAERLGMPLATLDDDLRAAAAKSGVVLL